MSDPALGAVAEISLPEDIGAEQATLGACMLSGSVMASIEQTLVPSDFFREAHRVVFGYMVRIYRQGRPVDLVTVASELRNVRMLEQVGGAEYLTALINELPSAAHGIHYARTVREHAVAREAIGIGRDLQHEIAGAGGNPRETMERNVSDAFRKLLIAAQELDCHIICLSQLAEDGKAKWSAQTNDDAHLNWTVAKCDRNGQPDIDGEYMRFAVSQRFGKSGVAPQLYRYQAESGLITETDINPQPDRRA